MFPSSQALNIPFRVTNVPVLVLGSYLRIQLACTHMTYSVKYILHGHTFSFSGVQASSSTVRGVSLLDITRGKKQKMTANMKSGAGVIIFSTKLSPKGLKSLYGQLCLELMPNG